MLDQRELESRDTRYTINERKAVVCSAGFGPHWNSIIPCIYDARANQTSTNLHYCI